MITIKWVVLDPLLYVNALSVIAETLYLKSHKHRHGHLVNQAIAIPALLVATLLGNGSHLYSRHGWSLTSRIVIIIKWVDLELLMRVIALSVFAETLHIKSHKTQRLGRLVMREIDIPASMLVATLLVNASRFHIRYDWIFFFRSVISIKWIVLDPLLYVNALSVIAETLYLKSHKHRHGHLVNQAIASPALLVATLLGNGSHLYSRHGWSLTSRIVIIIKWVDLELLMRVIALSVFAETLRIKSHKTQKHGRLVMRQIDIPASMLVATLLGNASHWHSRYDWTFTFRSVISIKWVVLNMLMCY